MSLKIFSSSIIKADVADKFSAPTGFEQKLPWLAPVMHISSNPEDYFMFPVPIMYSDLPNRNGVAFPLSELVKWNSDLKCQGYESWRYAPMFVEHQSDDITTAIGVVADVSLRKIEGYGDGKLWKVVALAAIDRTKNPELARRMEAGEINTYSMGAMVDGWTCSYCGAGEGKCAHIDPNAPVTFYELNGRMVFKNVFGIGGYELSVVEDPAYLTAISDHKISYK
jgi:hypothetical protein